ncbi:exosortase K [Desulfovibrio sp. OttesenSCG-928-O18]|nr:exosortase K [Desulfovibrio sp. OttesenSCG-928-O18]
MRKNAATFAPALLVIGTCVLFKWSFAGADATRLDWLLAPASTLVSLISGLSFVWLDSAGYYNAEHGILIAPACSGLNFFIILLATGGSLVMLYRRSLPWLAVATASAYTAALAVNVLRILLAMELYRHNFSVGPIGPERVHRIEGVVVYYVCLCLYAMVFSALLRKSAPAERRFRGPGCSVLLPLGCYLLFTLVLPLANGAARKFVAFAEHGVTVLLLTATLTAALYYVYRKRSRNHHELEQAENTHR